MTNEDRARAGRAALEAFTPLTYGGRSVSELHPDDVWTAAYDLVCDLGHALRMYRRGELAGAKWMADDVRERNYVTSLCSSADRHYREEINLGWDEEG